MSVIIHTASNKATESDLLWVECSFGRGFTGLQLIGNASEVVKNGMERAKAALESMGIQIPNRRIIISLTPADQRKDGNHFDLPIAVSLALLLSKQKPVIDSKQWMFAAELGLNGQLRPVKGLISFAIEAISSGLKGIIIAKDNLDELSALKRLHLEAIEDFQVIAFDTLQDTLDWLYEGVYTLTLNTGVNNLQEDSQVSYPSFADMILDENLKKIALVVASGLHSLMLYGPPGTGKSMFASRITSIMPIMNKRHHLESLKIHSSYTHKISSFLLNGRPPYRSPHHQASAAAIIGTSENPGEISLAHGGLLFLDEFPEFRRDIIESLREPLEVGSIQVSRAQKKVLWKSQITLLGACNPCPCGWLGSTKQRCICPTNKILAYKRKLSGPILDRIDLHVNVKEPKENTGEVFRQLQERKKNIDLTAYLREIVEKAREFATERNKSLAIDHNRDIPIEKMIAASKLNENTFIQWIEELSPSHLSKRTLMRSLRVARTLADIDQSDMIRKEDLLQAWQWTPENCAMDRGDFGYSMNAEAIN